MLLLLVYFFIFLRTQKKVFIAIDGTKFQTEEECKEYEKYLERFNGVYNYDFNQSNQPDKILGLSSEFIKCLKEEGFSEVKTLIKYREQFKLLSELFD